MSELIKRFLPFVSLVVLCIVIAVLEPRFLSGGNLAGIARQTAVITIMAIGMTMVMVSGGIDLSVGSMLALTSVLGAFVMAAGGPVLAGIAISIVAGAIFGLINGTTVATLRIPPFIVTLGAMGVYRGIALLATGGKAVVDLPSSFGNLAQGNVFGILPLPLLIVLLVALLAHFVLVNTRPGRYCYAIGSNVEAARYAGVRVSLYQIWFYVILGTLTGLAGAIESSRLVTGQPTSGDGYELRVIAAVVIGGASLSGGTGTILGSMIGALTMAVLRNGSNQMGWPTYMQEIIIGIVIMIAVGVDKLRQGGLRGRNG